jgi:ABC-type multidrug transport system fused ATPase/permease subunit
MADKSAHLHRQVEHITHRITRLRALSERYTRVRLALFVTGLVVSLLVFAQVSATAGWLSVAAGLVILFIVARYHRRVDQSIRRHLGYRHIKQTHIARIDLDWPNIPQADPAPVSPDHPFAVDLDMVGEHCLHHLLDTSVSREGGELLQSWLLTTVPDPQHIAHRQALVRELIPLVTLRDKLTLNAQLISGKRIEGKRLLSWFEYRASTSPTRQDVIIAAILAGLNGIAFLLASSSDFPQVWPITLIAYVLFARDRLSKAGDLFAQSLSLGELVTNLNAVFHFLETYRYGTTLHLKELCAPFLNAQERPSAQLRRVGRIVTATSLRANPILWFIINLVLPWDVFFAYLLNRRKAEIAARMPDWLDVWFELEALSALATFAALNPDYTFPEVTNGHAFNARQLGHPLIAHAAKVCNDFSLAELGTVVMITGSNMSGKSSFLRALGVNLCLAYAGSVVNADHLHTALFRVFSCVRVNDSVTEGFSYFYAEVRRLKALLDALERDHPYPLFFLIDEIFRGTNNRERLIGSRAYIRSLAGRNGIGAISTHDLELVRLADDLPQIINVHFREDVIDGQMVFDYLLRPGPSPTTNALKIMALEGLPVE